MRYRLFQIAILLLSSSAPAHAAETSRITIENLLAACTAIETRPVSEDHGIVSATALIEVNKPIGDCGCFSALASYESSVDAGGVRQILQQGIIGLRTSGRKTFVLASEPALVANKDITLRLSCAAPL